MKEQKTLGLIEHIKIKSSTGETVDILAKVDTGAGMSSIDKSLAERLGLNVLVDTKKIRLVSGSGIRPIVEVEFSVYNTQVKTKMTIADRSTMRYPVLIGADLIKRYDFKVNANKLSDIIPRSTKEDLKYRAAIISLGSLSSVWTAHEMAKLFKEVDNLNIRYIEIKLDPKNPEILYKGLPIENYDCIYVKGSYRYAQVLESITRALWGKCYLPLAAQSFAIVHDKLSTHLILQENKIPMPTTYFASSPYAAEKILKKIDYPVILKFPKGTQGKGVMFADSYVTAKTILDALTTLNQPFIIQEYIDTSGEDLRIIVAGDKVIGAMKRKALTGDVRSNIHAGGVGEAFEPNSVIKSIAIKTAKVLNADICGVDILESNKGPLVIEANISPGLQGITKATGNNISKEIAKYLFFRTKELREGQKAEDTSKIMDSIGLNKQEEKHEQQLIANIEMRGNRIILPELITDMSKLLEGEEITISAVKGKIEIRKA